MATFDEINAVTGFANGDYWESAEQIFDYFKELLDDNLTFDLVKLCDILSKSFCRRICMMKKVIARRIRYRRRMIDMTQEQFAEKMKVAQSTIVGWEHGLVHFTDERLCQIADVLQTSVDYFTAEEPFTHA